VVLTQSGFSGANDGLGAIGDLELVEDVREVIAHGFGAEEQALRDLGIVLALGE